MTDSGSSAVSWPAAHGWLLAASLVLALGCSEPTPTAVTPAIVRAFQSPDATFVEIDGRGRWAQSLELPAQVSDTVTLPAGAQLVLPWSVLGTVPDDEPLQVRVVISVLHEDAARILLRRNRIVGSQDDWFEEHLDLSAEGPGELQLEIRFDEVGARKREPRLAQAQIAVSPALLWSSTLSAADSRPDVILIAIDTLRADGLSPYGASRSTPNIEALANSGTLFEQAFSTASWTLPSFSSVFTATYPWTHQVTRETRSIPADLHTLAEVFAANGYRTAGFHNSGFVRPIFGFSRGFDQYTQTIGLRRFRRRSRHRLDDQANVPLMLFVHTYDVHDPYTSVPEEYHDLYTDPDYQDPKELRGRHISTAKDAPLPELDDDDFQFLRDLYDGEIRHVDDTLPMVFELLDKARPGRPRIVILFADHGESFGEQGRLTHHHSSGPVVELAHVPLIMAGNGIPTGRRVSEVVQTVDLLPTLIELLDFQMPSSSRFEGRSLAHHLQAEAVAADPRAVTFSTTSNLDVLRTDSWTLIRGRGNTLLYDRRADPAETHDLSAEHPEQVDRLLKVLDGKIAAGGLNQAQEIVIDEETHQDLKALGYLD